MTKVEEIFRSARSLPKRKRAELAELLLTSLDPPDLQPALDGEEWTAEMTRRAEEAVRADWKGSDWKTALARVRRGLKRRKK